MIEDAARLKIENWGKSANLVTKMTPKQLSDQLSVHYERKAQRKALRKKVNSDRWMGEK